MALTKLILSFTSILIVATVCAQDLQMTSFSTSEGLSQPYITSIFQDKRGFIWVGTFYGLNRFDGQRFKSYLPNRAGKWSLKSNKINHIAEDEYGLLWLSTEDGTFIMDPVTEKFVQLTELNTNYSAGFTLKTIHQPDGKIWLYQKQKNTTKIFIVQSNNTIKQYIRDNQKKLPTIKVDSLPLPTSLASPLNLFFKIDQKRILITDSNGQTFEINTSLHTVHPSSLQSYAQALDNDLLLISNLERSQGFIINKTHNYKDIIAMDLLNTCLTLPDGNQLLFRFYDTQIYKVDNLDNKAFDQNLKNLASIYSIDQAMSYSKFIDRQGNIWIGTTGYGIRKISKRAGGYRHLMPKKVVYNFSNLTNDQLWPGCFENTSVLNIQTGLTSAAPWTALSSSNFPPNLQKYIVAVATNTEKNIIFLLESNDLQKQNRLYQYHINSKQIEKLPIETTNFSVTPPLMMVDPLDNLWIAESKGEIIRWNPTTKTANHWNLKKLYPSDISENVLPRQIILDKQSNIWIATNYGITKISNISAEPEFKVWDNYAKENVLFGNNGILCIYPDAENPNLVWLGTMGGGLGLFDYQNESITYFNDDTFPNIIIGIVPDNFGNLWLSTTNGIFCFDLKLRDFININLPNHLSMVDFNAASTGKLENGDLLFGSGDGIYIIQPSIVFAPNQVAKVLITNIKVNGKSLLSESESKQLSFKADDSPNLKLNHDENSIIISLAAPEAQNMPSVQYQYRIASISPNWINNGSQNNISLTGLQPGSYLVEIQLVALGQNKENIPTSTIEIHVLPPWHKTNLAYLLYTIGALLSIWGLIIYDRKRIILRQESQLSQQEMKRIASLEQLKSKFFAYIAHEFKTPLTIIMGVSELFKQSNQINNPAEFVEPILRESNNMIQLIDEILDISRLENGTIQLNLQQQNLIDFLRQTIDRFTLLATDRSISLEFNYAQDQIMMDFDQVRLRYIINNLLSNALYYTPQGGSIVIYVEKPTDGFLSFKISDTGNGIPADSLPHIFEKYYSAHKTDAQSNHFGLGLSFVHDLLKMMNGNITVESSLDQGTTFWITLPFLTSFPQTKKGLIEMNTPNASLDLLSVGIEPPANAPLLLIVDDNPSIVAYLKLCLQPHFILLFAKDGKEGLETATQEIPDLILTDVMMPTMDGLEMTLHLKQGALTSHIPIVMLSAKSEFQDRINAQKLGADLYIQKPFHNEELIISLQNLYKLQQKWKDRYQLITSSTSNVSTTPPTAKMQEDIDPTDVFIKNLYQVFEENYQSETLDLNQICRLLHISKTQLYRKLSSVSDQSAVELLKDFRLEKAMSLLKNNPEINTKQVAYLVGFRERSHFSNIFSKKYNISPSEVRKKST